MIGWYRIDAQRDACLIGLVMGGFFDGETIKRLRKELVCAVATLPCPPNCHLTLCDIREMSIQSQQRVDEFARLVGSSDIRSRRLAFVTAASLARMQARRLTDRDGVEFFSDPDVALEWLRA